MSHRKPMAAAAALTAALALAVPAARADASTPSLRLPPGSLPCQILINQVRFAAATGNVAFETIASNVFVYSGCGGAAI